MLKVLRLLLLLLVITAMVWLSTLWRWQTGGIDPDGWTVFLHLVLLPLALTAALIAAIWLVQRIRKTLAAPTSTAKADEKPSAGSASS